MADTPGLVTVDVSDLDLADPADVVEVMLRRAAQVTPDWTPTEYDPGVVLMEAIADPFATLAGLLEITPAQAALVFTEMAGLTRDTGAPARVEIAVTAADTLGHVVPAGTVMVLDDPTADSPRRAVLEADLTILPGTDTGTGMLAAETVGVVTGLSTTTGVTLVDAISYIEAITVTAVDTAGRDADTDATFAPRAAAFLAESHQVLVRPEQLAARCLTDLRVGRALAVQRWDGTGASPGTVAGAVTVLLLGATGAVLPAGTLTAIRDSLADACSLDLTVHVGTPTVTAVNVAVTITLRAGHTAAVVTAAVDAAIRAHLSVLDWTWGQAVRLSVLKEVIETTTGVDGATITAPSADVVIGPRDFIKPGTITITVA